MTAAERRTYPVPYGHHVYVVSDLSLSPTTDVTSRPVKELLNLLGDIDDAAVVVVAGNLFYPDSTADLAKHIEATLAALPSVRDGLRQFCAVENHRLFVLPGCDDFELRDHDRAQELLRRLGICVASDLVLQIATAGGVRDLAVAAGTYDLDVEPVKSRDRSDADRLEDPPAIERFVASRTLYRRLGAWLWLPVIAFGAIDLWSLFATLANHFARHHYRVHLLHTRNFWVNLFVILVLIALAETVVAAFAGLLVRLRFTRASHGATEALFEPLAFTKVDGVDALEFARRIVERGGAGAVMGGTPSSVLAFLDNGVAAAPGPSRTVIVEQRGRFGLPPVFASTDRLGVVEIEAASTVRVRLFSGETPRRRGSLLERLLGGPSVQPGPTSATTTLGSWPSGKPFPLNVERLEEQRRQRTIRRWSAGLIFLDGLLNVAVTTVRPLRSHLHLALSMLPLDVAKGAAALTAVAGIVMIMLARGLRRGQHRAWFLAVTILAATIVFHVLRGGSVISLLIAGGILVVLIGQRRYFQASSDRTSASETLWLLGIVAVVAVWCATLGIEATSHRHHQLPNLGVVLVACAERLVGQYDIALPDRVSDFVNPTLLAIGLSLIVLAIFFLTRPVVDRRLSTSASTRERRLAELRAREIVRRHGHGTLDYFALRDDKQFFFYRDSLVAYAVYGGVALISPDPIGPEAERTEVFSAFREFAEARGWTIGVMAAGEEWLGIYHAAGLHYLYLGDEAIVDCQTFSLVGHRMKGLRQACTRLSRHGYTIEFFDPATMDPALVTDIVALISLLRRGGGERGFSMMLGRLFDPRDKGLLLTVVYGPDGKPAAVCQFVPSPAINGYSLDLMRRDPGEHPNGLIDYALCSTIEHLRLEGASGLSLNFAAFRSVLEGEKDSTFTRVERWALKRLSGILPIESLWSFNSKYHPTWLPRHLVYPAAESFVPVVAATLRAESITELPVVGRFLANDPANRPGTVVPDEVLAAAREVDRAESARK
ncbi:MAG: phosphatidylglycerol lysyltransferase domain-containing protein [Acidimicrobiales bacterium]